MADPLHGEGAGVVDPQRLKIGGGLASIVRTDACTQEEHHRKLSYQDEVRALLRRHELEWDERYVWD